MKVKNTKLRSRLGLLTLTFLLGSIVAFAQGTPNVAGTYEGTVKMPNGQEGKS